MSAGSESNIPPIGEDDLQAFIDGRLPLERRADVEAWLAAHPGKAHTLDADRRIRATLRAAADALIEPVPASMRVAELRRATAVARGRLWRSAAAAVMLIMLGGSGGWVLRAALSPSSTVGTMTDATSAWRIFANDPFQPVELNAEFQVQLASWIAGHVRRSIDIPDLSEMGLRFLGGRLLSADAGPAGLFLYEDAGKDRFIFYVRETSGERPKKLQIRVSQGVETRFWFDGHHGYAIAGPTNSPRLAAATDIVRRLYQGTKD
ncbi:MAG: anti-sigma factor [Hyphomicrobiales bacterium]|nr:anti-sigma factor [Hyphomicrobiales bacterium]